MGPWRVPKRMKIRDLQMFGIGIEVAIDSVLFDPDSDSDPDGLSFGAILGTDKKMEIRNAPEKHCHQNTEGMIGIIKALHRFC